MWILTQTKALVNAEHIMEITYDTNNRTIIASLPTRNIPVFRLPQDADADETVNRFILKFRAVLNSGDFFDVVPLMKVPDEPKPHSRRGAAGGMV